MPRKASPILGGFSQQRSLEAANNEAINLAVEIVETKDGFSTGNLFMMSGLVRLYTAGAGPILGLLPLNDTLYAVSGSQVYSISANGTVTLLGTVSGSPNPVSMFKNTRQLLIVDGTGAWLVPGGYPITGGRIVGGSLYKVSDKIVLVSGFGGTQTAYPQIQITSIANNPVTTFAVPNAGTTYNSAASVPTTPIQPQLGAGVGLLVNVTVGAGGVIASAAVSAGGSGWAIGDTGSVGGGGTNGFFQVLTVVAGGVTSLRILNPGAGYANGVAPTTRGNVFPANVGTGLTFDTAAAAGPLTGVGLHSGGQNYSPGDVGTITGGTGDATYLVYSVGGNGVVTGFTVLSGGAITSPAGAFTQLSTDGGGSGLTLQSPTYAAFLGLIPITLPFLNPVAGVVIDGFGLIVFLNQQVIAQSNQLDLSTWPALSFGVANQSPDNNISIASLHDQAYLFKEQNTEVWANAGTSPFAFAPLGSVHIEFGSAAPFSASKTDNELIWLAKNDQGQATFLKVDAYAPQLISTQALTNQLQKYATISDCIAYSRQEGGHTYYVATFPGANVTWCYDKTSSELVGFPVWTKMAALSNGEINRHWGNAFSTWSGGQPAVATTSTYQAQSVFFTNATSMETTTGLNGLPSSFSNAVFSVWIDVPNGGGHTGVIFGNQQGGVAPGFRIQIQNDGTGAPEITVRAWDAASAPIVVATYNFATWGLWVNVLVSINTATNQLQVYANILSGNVLLESLLTPASIVWSSTNPIGAIGTTHWSLNIV